MAVCPGHRLLFNKKNTADKSGEANVAAHEGSEVWRVLYTISDDDLKKLDKGKGGQGLKPQLVRSGSANLPLARYGRVAVMRPDLSAAVLADRRTLTGGVKARRCQRTEASVWMVFELLNGIWPVSAGVREITLGLTDNRVLSYS